MKSSLDKTLSMLDVLGSEANYFKYKTTLEKTLPQSLSGEKDRYWMMYAKIAQQFISDPKISDKKSVLNCMFNAVKLGLSPDPIFGYIYFVPYKGVLTYQVGYKGMVRLSLNTGAITSVRTGIVYKKDTWHYHEDEYGQHYMHEPNFYQRPGTDNQELLVYSIFTSSTGKHDIHVMPSYHVDEIKKMVLARTPHSPWSNPVFEPEMRKKTCLRRHWKMQPMSVEIAGVIESEEANERGELKNIVHDELKDIIPESLEIPDSYIAEDDPLSVFDQPKQQSK